MRVGGGIKVGRHLRLMMMSERERKRVIERKKAALLKQAKELCVLCDVEIGIAMYEGDCLIDVWPCVEEARKRFLGFWGLPEAERVKKMVTHEKFVRDWVNGEIEKMRKKEDEVERKEMNVVMKKVIQGESRFEEIQDARQLMGLYALADEKMQELEKRKQHLLQLRNHGGAAGVPPLATAADSASWFVPAMAPLPPATASWFVPAMAPLPVNGGGGGEGTHRDMIFSDVDFNQVWP
ncbi:PREDICTED: agamous-like MADS-box protein AGL92 [Ipomoea nil]|uniref:agamous-like MADS-box protein AGL92 n=1 Tax=Ipomoea nil TaxID=35883 RepID=UPI0009010D54|nr:PREDICTED: agamous-like MADS-box protein AGL92 [Ipomoea nil]